MNTHDTIMITTVTASKVRKAMTPTRVPTNTGIGITASLRPVSVLMETDVNLSASVAFTEVVMCVVSSSSVVEAISKLRVLPIAKLWLGVRGSNSKWEYLQLTLYTKHNTG